MPTPPQCGGTLLPRWEFWGCFPPCVAPVTPTTLPGRSLLYPHNSSSSQPFQWFEAFHQQFFRNMWEPEFSCSASPALPSVVAIQKKALWHGSEKLRSHFISTNLIQHLFLLQLLISAEQTRTSLYQFQSDIPQYVLSIPCHIHIHRNEIIPTSSRNIILKLSVKYKIIEKKVSYIEVFYGCDDVLWCRLLLSSCGVSYLCHLVVWFFHRMIIGDVMSKVTEGAR